MLRNPTAHEDCRAASCATAKFREASTLEGRERSRSEPPQQRSGRAHRIAAVVSCTHAYDAGIASHSTANLGGLSALRDSSFLAALLPQKIGPLEQPLRK